MSKQSRRNKKRTEDELKVEYVPVSEPKPADWNPRTMLPEEMEKLKASIERLGFLDPIVVRRSDMLVVGGHQRLEAAKQLGHTTVPIVRVDLTDQEVKLANVALNRIEGRWHTMRLASLFQELRVLPVGELEVTGFVKDEVSAIIRSLDWDRRPDPDLVPEPPKRPTAKPGDLWQLGAHAILCGDSSQADAVRRLIGDATIDLVFTDPPYGIHYDPGARPGARTRGRKIAGDELSQEDLRTLLEGSLSIAFDAASPGAPAYVFHASTQAEPVLAAFRTAGWRLAACLVWVKPNPTFTRGDYQWAHEPLLYGWKAGARHRWFGGRSESTLWHIGREGNLPDSPDRSSRHPTQKPVALVERAISNSSRPGDTVFDPFAGSGTAVIACERLARRCLAVEIDPAFVDLAVARWERYTGQKAQLAEEA